MNKQDLLVRSFVVMMAVFAPMVLASELSDPTAPVNAPLKSDAKQAWGGISEHVPVLQSILIAPTRRVAIVDGLPVVEGSVVSGYTITRIASTGVSAFGAKGKIELKLMNDVKKWEK